MHNDIEQILIPQSRIAARVAELAEQIVLDHTPPRLLTGELTIIPVMTGAMIFTSDLIRRMPIAMKIGLMLVSSYPGASVKSQGVQMLAERVGEIRGHHVIVIDDILDSGQTLTAVSAQLRQMGAAAVRTCVLLRKDRPQARAFPVDYVGFDIPDAFIVGYGLDYNDFYRNLPDIVTLNSGLLRAE